MQLITLTQHVLTAYIIELYPYPASDFERNAFILSKGYLAWPFLNIK